MSKEEKELLRKQMAFEEKESHRWLDMFQSGEQIARANPGTEDVVVGDSESDIQEIFAEVRDLPQNCHFVIRGCQDRAVGGRDDAQSVDQVLSGATTQIIREVQISERVSKITGETRPRRKSRSARLAQISVRSVQLTLRGPSRPGGRLADVTLNAVEAVELAPPEGGGPIHWVLFTTLSIDIVDNLVRIIKSYACRWNIELYFETLKTGLKIEKLKYETLERYLKAFALHTIVGWRVEYLKGAARIDSEASVEKYFTADAWTLTYLVYHDGGDLPEEPPTITEFMLIVAELTGWQRKKNQGPPWLHYDLAWDPKNGSVCGCFPNLQKSKSKKWGIKRLAAAAGRVTSTNRNQKRRSKPLGGRSAAARPWVSRLGRKQPRAAWGRE